MKKLLLITFAAILIAGCSKKGNPSGITGKWFLVADSLAQYTNGSLVGHSTTNYNHQNYLQFNTDGSGLYDIIQETSPGDNVALDVFESFTYTETGSTITLNIPVQTVGNVNITRAFVETATKKSETSNSMTLVFDQSIVQNGSTYRQVEIQTFTR